MITTQRPPPKSAASRSLLKVLGISTTPQSQLSLQIDIDKALWHKRCEDASAWFITLAPGASVISGTLKIQNNTAKTVHVSEVDMSFSTVVSTPGDEGSSTGTFINNEETVLWNESKDFEPGSHSVPFSFPFAAHLPSTIAAGSENSGTNIIHSVEARCKFRTPGKATVPVRTSRGLKIYRHTPEEAKAVVHQRWIYRHAAQQTVRSRYTGFWRLHAVIPTHAVLGLPLTVYFAADAVRGDGKLVPADPRLLSVRLIEKMDFGATKQISRQAAPWTKFRSSPRTNISNDGMAVTFDVDPSSPFIPNDHTRPYYSAVIPTSGAQPRTTNEFVAVIHNLEFKVSNDFGGLLPGETHLFVPCKIVCVQRRTDGSFVVDDVATNQASHVEETVSVARLDDWDSQPPVFESVTLGLPPYDQAVEPTDVSSDRSSPESRDFDGLLPDYSTVVSGTESSGS
ncbi:hypothetical protein HKX48_005805 [Thoreauomyces humboldtii]|nr:hypothetical protein HKX48_005805 [Thoreauomyces humboldtii]